MQSLLETMTAGFKGINDRFDTLDAYSRTHGEQLAVLVQRVNTHDEEIARLRNAREPQDESVGLPRTKKQWATRLTLIGATVYALLDGVVWAVKHVRGGS